MDEDEVADVLIRPGEDRPGREGSRVAIGQTQSGRYLRVIYVPDPEPGSVFVVTAYERVRTKMGVTDSGNRPGDLVNRKLVWSIPGISDPFPQSGMHPYELQGKPLAAYRRRQRKRR